MIEKTNEQVGNHTKCPLVIDLDGALTKTDLLIESTLLLLRRAPLTTLFCVPLWILKGRAVLKREIAKRVDLPVALLPYRHELLDYLRTERNQGQSLVLVSASDELLVGKVAKHLQLFDRYIASDGQVNLNDEAKCARLLQEFGERGFDYVADSRAALPIWKSARQGLVVSPSKRLRERVSNRIELSEPLDIQARSPLAYVKALRAHHWIKNLLIFIPILAAHRINELALVTDLAIGFICFCLLTSALYVFNDLLDLNTDRRHPQKQLRPFASGDAALLPGILMIPTLIVAAFALSWQLRPEFILALSAYLVLTVAYSLRLKTIVLLDVIVLAALFVLRIVAGAGDIPLSRWVLGFSMFFFLSLALLKRYTEITTMRAVEGRAGKVRGYQSHDASLILSLGTASGYLSVVVLALYVDTATAQRLYTHNELIWLVCPVLLYWISYLWLMAHRNRMPHDPVVFAVKNYTSRVLTLIMAALIVLAI